MAESARVVVPLAPRSRCTDATPARQSTSEAEHARLRALARYAILDTPADEAFDDLVDMACLISGCSVAAIGFFDRDRVWFKAAVGLDVTQCASDDLLDPGDRAVRREVKGAFAPYARSGTLLSSPMVTSDGYTLGCLLAADGSPAVARQRAQEALNALARQAVRLLEFRRTTLAYHTVVDGVGNVVFHVDSDDRLVSITPTWSQLTGFGVVRSVGQRLTDFVHEEDRHALTRQLALVRTSATPPHGQCRLKRLVGDDVPVEVVARPLLDEHGRAFGLVGVLADISERQAREVEAQHMQKLEALGRLSAGLAHEINTPIQFVGDNARFLAQSYEAMLKLVLTYRRVLDVSAGAISWWERQEMIQRAELEADVDYLAEEVPSAVRQSLDGVERVASLVRAMKTFSHPGSGGQVLADLNEALRATMTVARNQVRYIADPVLDLGEVPPLMCNIGDLNQVFLNMVLNAADSIEEKGTHGTITVTSRAEGDDVVIEIADTGNGISDQVRNRIFEPFFTTKDVGRGTGQGLALARAVVQDQHAGRISLTSQVGVGTTFTIRLPIAGNEHHEEDDR